MSKAMLIIRRMPEKCDECPFCSENEQCYAVRDSFNRPEKAKFYDKPGWCPIQEISQKQEFRNAELYKFLEKIALMLGYCGMNPKELEYVNDLRRILMEWEEYKKKECSQGK